MEVSVMHLMPTLMERQLDPPSGFLLKQAIEARGVKVYTKANTKEILGDGPQGRAGVRVCSTTERELHADLVVMAVGIRPSAAIARDAGLDGQSRHRGRCRTCAPAIPTFSRSANAPRRTASASASWRRSTTWRASSPPSLPATPERPSTRARPATKLKVTGINLFSAGDFSGRRGPRGDRAARRRARRLQRLVLKDGKLIGVVLYGDVSRRRLVFDLLKRGADVSDIRESLMFGPGAAGAPRWTLRRPLQRCRMMRKSAAATASARARSSRRSGEGLTTLDQVRAHTKASACCGSCTGLVEQVI